MTPRQQLVDVAVVGGGPAGAALAARVAGKGHRVVVLEARARWTWQAGGVFSSPAVVDELDMLGLDLRGDVWELARPIPAMRVETPGGTTVRLTYGAELGGAPPVGLDRSRLDPALLQLAERCGADVRRPVSVTGLSQAAGDDDRITLQLRRGATTEALDARVVVGADGYRSTVARSLGVARPPRLGKRIGLTWHLEGVGGGPRDARMVVLDGAYCGLAPVPGGRLNVGIVLASARWRRLLATNGAAATGAAVLARVPDAPGFPGGWRDAPVADAIAGAAPLGQRVACRAGEGWLLVGDAAGFLDPFTGEGLHRALVSARLGAAAVLRALGDDRRRDDRALREYDRAMRRRFRSKDVVSMLVQGFLAQPALFEYAARRLARRSEVRATMGLVMGDLVPASRALDPRFLAALLVP